MKIWGKIIGSIIGISAGPFGIVFGFIIGHLIDQLTIKIKHDGGSIHDNSSSFFSKHLLNLLHYTVGTGGLTNPYNQNLFNSFCVSHNFPQLKKYYFHVNKSEPDKMKLIHSCVYISSSRKYNSPLKEEILKFLYSCQSEINMTPRIKEINKVFSNIPGVPLNSENCKILGIHPYAEEDEVKQAFRRLASEYHPDKRLKEKDNEKFIKIRTAYERLMEELKHR
jgi:hypothetical protein